MTIQHSYLLFTVEEHEQILKSANILMENTAWYLDELKQLDKKIIDTLALIFRPPGEGHE